MDKAKCHELNATLLIVREACRFMELGSTYHRWSSTNGDA